MTPNALFLCLNSHGDGLQGDGSYEVFSDGVQVVLGGKFTDSEFATFGSCPPKKDPNNGSSPPVESLSRSPTAIPISNPTAEPTRSPTTFLGPALKWVAANPNEILGACQGDCDGDGDCEV